MANDGTTYRTTLLEGAGTNEVTRAKALDHADWTTLALSAVTADQATGPDNASTLEELVEDSSASTGHGVYQDATLTADATYALSCWAIANTRSFLLLRMNEAAAGANTVRAYFNLSTGAVGTTGAGGTGSFTRAYVEDWTDVAAGLYRCVLVGSIGNSATSIRAQVKLADADNSEAYTGDGSSSLYAGFAQLEDDAEFASSFMDSVASATSRDADLLQESDIGFTLADIEAAGGLTVLSEWVEMGTALEAVTRYWQIGGPNPDSTPFLRLRSDGDGTLRGEWNDGGGTKAGTPATSISLFDRAQVRTVLFKDGSDWKVRVGVSVNGGAETTSDSTAIGSSLPAAWSANTFTVGAAPDDTLHGFAGHIRHKFALGTERTLAEMEAL